MRKVDIYDIEVRQRGALFELCIGDDVIKTPTGDVFADRDRGVVQMVLDDLRDVSTLRTEGERLLFTGDVSCYEIHCVSAKWSIEQDGILQEQLRSEFRELAVATRSVFVDDARLGPVLDSIGAGARGLGAESVSRMFSGLSRVERACVRCLTDHHGCPGWLGVIAIGKRLPNIVYARAMTCILETCDAEFLSDSMPVQMARFRRLRSGAWRAERMIGAWRNNVVALIEEGESEAVEFKSTWRRNLVTGKHDKRVTEAALRAVASFLNTAGGALVIGVKDDSDPIGGLVAKDGLQTEDKFC